jgi:hypothetical protein
MEELEYKLIKVGQLKYDRIKSLSILRKEIKFFGYCDSMNDVKILLDNVLNNNLKEKFNYSVKRCLDSVFEGNQYIEYNGYPIERNFPDPWIPPQA